MWHIKLASVINNHASIELMPQLLTNVASIELSPHLLTNIARGFNLIRVQPDS